MHENIRTELRRLSERAEEDHSKRVQLVVTRDEQLAYCQYQGLLVPRNLTARRLYRCQNLYFVTLAEDPNGELLVEDELQTLKQASEVEVNTTDCRTDGVEQMWVPSAMKWPTILTPFAHQLIDGSLGAGGGIHNCLATKLKTCLPHVAEKAPERELSSTRYRNQNIKNAMGALGMPNSDRSVSNFIKNKISDGHLIRAGQQGAIRVSKELQQELKLPEN